MAEFMVSGCQDKLSKPKKTMLSKGKAFTEESLRTKQLSLYVALKCYIFNMADVGVVDCQDINALRR